MSTRPRITFDSRGFCNACVWTETKSSMDWSPREEQLRSILEKYRSKTGLFDCIVPVSGGKDGSYVSYQLKNKYGMSPLAVTITPPLPTDIGKKNLENFINSGYDHISVSIDPKAMQAMNKIGFIDKGFPYYGWLIAIHTAVINIAAKFNIGLIFYGEDGEMEYGGSSETADSPVLSLEYIKRVWFEDPDYERFLINSSLSPRERFFFEFPDEANSLDLSVVTWSYFENWDPYRNYLIAKNHCGLEEASDTNSGTFTNFAQNDQALYALHTYLMYLKFGFGRANQDACIEIRRGAMDREQAKTLVTLYDGVFPFEFVDQYLDYFDLTRLEFDEVLDRWANTELFIKQDGFWKPKFEIV